MEDEAEKMVALKKAYADIILNTAKESAARVMESERKARRFQHDLCASRDESLRMLLRLKNMLDSKTHEADLNFSYQQSRIEELEAQLQEAEEVITDLQSELKRTRDELENVKTNHLPINGSSLENSEPFSSSGSESMEASNTKNEALDHRVLDDKCCSTVAQTDNFDLKKADLASIIMRSKKPELYRNGCTQRIRAYEGNAVDDSPVESELITKDPENELRDFNLGCDEMEVEKLPQAEKKNPSKVRTFRRRKTRFGKAKPLSRCQHGPSQKPSILAEASEGLQENMQNLIKIVQKGKRKRNSRSGNDVDAPSSTCPSPVLSRCRTFAYLVNGGIKSVEENETTMKQLPRFDPGVTVNKTDSNSTSEAEEAIIESELDHVAKENDVKLTDDQTCRGSELSVEIANSSPLNDCDVEAATKVAEQVNESRSSGENNRLLKYTFQRKRKREAEFASPEKSSVKKMIAEEHTAPESEKSTVIAETSRESRRLAQVARQLISMSGSRWQ